MSFFPQNPLGDFPEDFHLENGNYSNTCIHCKEAFAGHKRRKVCKKCEIEGVKKWIDNATYEQLLQKVRFTPIGDPIFQGEVGQYFNEVMGKKRSEHKDPVSASKKIGWERPNPFLTSD